MPDPVDVVADALRRVDRLRETDNLHRRDARAALKALAKAGFVLVSPEQAAATRRGLGDLASVMRQEPINVDAYNQAVTLANSWEVTPDA